jgi:hypothetical protein
MFAAISIFLMVVGTGLSEGQFLQCTMDARNPIAVILYGGNIVADNDYSALFIQFFEQPQEALPGICVKVGFRLVEQKQTGTRHNGTGKHRTLQLTAAKLTDRCSCHISQFHLSYDGIYPTLFVGSQPHTP